MTVRRDGVDVAAWRLEPRCDLDAVHVLARVRLRAARSGCTVRVEGAPPSLGGLLELAGLGGLFDGPG